MVDAIVRLVAQTLNIDPSLITDESSPENTRGWDSLASLNLITAIEETFSVELSLPEMMAMHDVGLVRTVLLRKGVAING